MDSLFGIPLTSIMISLLVLMTAAFAIIGWIVWRNPLLVRMGLRNVARRKAQTTLIAVGLMLSTLIISAAFATGDTVGFSITNELYRQMEEVDFVIASDTEAFSGPSVRDETLQQDFLAALQDEFDDDEQIDGITGIVVETLPVVNLERRLSEPEATVVGVDPATVDSFRALRALDGRPIAAATLGGNSTYITERLADAVAAGPGDTLTVFFDNEPHQFKVIDAVRDTSVTGGAAEELTTGGIVVHIETLRQLTHTSGYSYIAVSARGGTRDSVALSDSTIEERIEAFIDSHPEANAHILFTKEEFIAIGELIGSVFVTFFLIMGLFSIAAGIMLVFLIFIMLAAERRPEMGMARAVGMNRLHLTESFLAEGMAYNVGSAAVGALAGLAVAALLDLRAGPHLRGLRAGHRLPLQPAGVRYRLQPGRGAHLRDGDLLRLSRRQPQHRARDPRSAGAAAAARRGPLDRGAGEVRGRRAVVPRLALDHRHLHRRRRHPVHLHAGDVWHRPAPGGPARRLVHLRRATRERAAAQPPRRRQ